MRAAGWALVASMLGTTAHAVEGLQWQWNEGESRTYLIQNDVNVPEFLTLYNETNQQPVIGSFSLTMVTTCTLKQPIGKQSFLVSCDIVDAALIGEPTPSSKGRSLETMQAWVDAFENKVTVEFVQTREGKIRSFEMRGMQGFNQRTNLREGIMREMLRRAYALFDVHFPKKGTDKGMGLWSQRDGMGVQMMSVAGSMGATRLTHTIVAEQETSIISSFEGSGTVMSGETDDTLIQTAFKMDIAGSTNFDRSCGCLKTSQLVTKGTPTASSARVESGAGREYSQSAFMQLLEPGAEAPNLPETAER